MPDKDIEQLLRSLPLRTLAPEAEREIATAIRAARRTQRPRPWHRSIPLWQAAAACVLACAAGWWLGASRGEDRPEALTPKTVFVRLDEPLFPLEQPAVERLDISRWQTVN